MVRYIIKHGSERQTQKLMFVNIIVLAKIQCFAIDIKQALYNWDSSSRANKIVCEVLGEVNVQAACVKILATVVTS